jgi:hypothetical protein
MGRLDGGTDCRGGAEIRLDADGNIRDPCNGGGGFYPPHVGAAPAGVARNHALGRLRHPARAALRPLCEELAALARWLCGFKKRGPELVRSFHSVQSRQWSAVRRGVSIARDAAVLRKHGEYRLRLSALRPPRRVEGQEEYRRARAFKKTGPVELCASVVERSPRRMREKNWLFENVVERRAVITKPTARHRRACPPSLKLRRTRTECPSKPWRRRDPAIHNHPSAFPERSHGCPGQARA